MSNTEPLVMPRMDDTAMTLAVIGFCWSALTLVYSTHYGREVLLSWFLRFEELNPDTLAVMPLGFFFGVPMARAVFPGRRPKSKTTYYLTLAVGGFISVGALFLFMSDRSGHWLTPQEWGALYDERGEIMFGFILAWTLGGTPHLLQLAKYNRLRRDKLREEGYR
jgi:hypothetical protein